LARRTQADLRETIGIPRKRIRKHGFAADFSDTTSCGPPLATAFGFVALPSNVDGGMIAP
jgi:hypothetical protein